MAAVNSKISRGIRQFAASHLKLSQRAVIIAIRAVKMLGAGEMRFAGIGLQADAACSACSASASRCRSVVGADSVKRIVRVNELD